MKGRGATPARRLLSSVVLLAAVAAGTLSSTPAQAAPVAAAEASSVTAASGGWNDWGCRPSVAHPRPVVLLHGLGGQRYTNWFYHAPLLRDAGYCVFSFTYGQGVLGEAVAGTGSIRSGAAQTAEFVGRVLAATGAAEVDLVGHSGGTVNAAYYLKFLGGADKVENFVGFGSNFSGSSIHGFARLLQQVIPWVPVTTSLVRSACPACLEALEGSALMTELNAGGLTVPGVRYTSVISRWDSVVTPYTNGTVSGPDARTIVLKKVCPLDASGHVAMVISPNVTTLIERALDPAAAAEPMRCRPALPIPL